MKNAKQAVVAMVRQKIHWLDRVDSGQSDARAALAMLRRGLGKAPAEIPDIWAITMTRSEDAADSALPDERTEWAVHIALTLYALHRQGKSGSMNDSGREENGVHRSGNSFGGAMGALRRMNVDHAAGVVRRFNSSVTSEGLAEFSRHAMGAVQLLRASEQPVQLDYPAFAGDLFDYQFASRREGVVLKWGRDFWRDFSPKPKEQKTPAVRSQE